jgi:hypothetical protein
MIVVVVTFLKESGDGCRFRDAGCLDNQIIEGRLLVLGELYDLFDEIAAQIATDTAILHRDDFVGLDKTRRFDEALVDIEFSHIVDHDSASEVVISVLGLENVAQKGRLAGSEEAADKGDGQLPWLDLWLLDCDCA